MAAALHTDMLKEAKRIQVKNAENKFLSEIIEIACNSTNEVAEYIILKCSTLYGDGERFFALPTCPTLVKITEAGKIRLMISKDDLKFAKGIKADQCPATNFQVNPLSLNCTGTKSMTKGT